MTDTIIKVENLGKKYSISHKTAEPYTALRDVMANKVKSLTGKILFPFKENDFSPKKEDFWALKNISFDVKRGERIGIIGRNGAGKTTLLKVLSRITDPTIGKFKIKGRVASLLEVGTGFHPELTGRENIYLNGAILGMHKREIKNKFDEIVEFAEIEKFLDTPVKRYSSGMYVRLAFSVASHLEPDILLVDEVLAVGDAYFQKKCLGKMESISNDGQTVLFISHNMGLISGFCSETIVLDQGCCMFYGDTNTGIQKYFHSENLNNSSHVDLSEHRNRLPGMKKILKSLSIKRQDGSFSNVFLQNEPIILEINYHSNESLAGAGFIINSTAGIRVGGFNTYMAFKPPHKIPSTGKIRWTIPDRILNPGTYSVTVSLGPQQNDLIDKVENVSNFIIEQSDIYDTGYLTTADDGVTSLHVKTEVF